MYKVCIAPSRAWSGAFFVYDNSVDHKFVWADTHAEALAVREAWLREQEAYEYHENGIDYAVEVLA